uniref:Putative secreted protein n=1 Tax=Anopheles darlingi TaxID=43151 RepID=A0A2M4DAX0_ANODA
MCVCVCVCVCVVVIAPPTTNSFATLAPRHSARVSLSPPRLPLTHCTVSLFRSRKELRPPAQYRRTPPLSPGLTITTTTILLSISVSVGQK